MNTAKAGTISALIVASFATIGAASAPMSKMNDEKISLKKEMTCLAQVIYDESRGEPFEGKIAVGNVVLNRAKTWERNVCGVVYHKRGKVCQFSGMCQDNKPFSKETMRIAWELMNGMHNDNTNGATYFHATYVNPKWKTSFKKTTQIGNHIFYFSKQTLS